MATALYLSSKHTNLIRAGVKTAIVKSRKFDIGFKELQLITKIDGQGYDFGKIILSAAIEIFNNDFKLLRSQHRITDNERKDWAKKQKLWGKEPLYFYKILSRKLLETPREIKIPQATQKHSQILGVINLEFLTPLKPFVNTKIPKSNEFFSTKDLNHFDFSKHLVEFKLRGIRIQLHKEGDTVNGYTRFGNRIPQLRLEPVLQELKNQEAYSLILDGELFIPGCSEDDVFTAISYEPKPNIEVAVFDILHIDGRSLTREVLTKRKEILEGAVKSGNHIKTLQPIEDFSIDSIGQLTDQVMKTEELEGFVFKDKNSKYLPTENVKWFKFVMIDKFFPEKEVEAMSTTELKKNRILFRRLLRKIDEGKSTSMDRVHIETMLDDINEKCGIPENWDATDFGLKFGRVNRANVKQMSKDVLLGMHYRTHQHFKRLMGYKHRTGKSLADTINAHYWLSQEMIRRGFSHHFTSSLDTISLRFRGLMKSTDRIEVRKFIKNVKTYDPKKQPKRLPDDWRIVAKWWADIREGKKSKYSKDQILTLAKKIIKEMTKRGLEMHPETMKPYSRELYSKATKQMKDNSFGLMPIYRGELSEEGEKIKLTDLTDKIEECILIEDFVTVVGSLVNWRETEGDIDILVKAPPDSDIFKLIRWRFMRAFPEFKERFEFIEYGMWQGPFTNHQHLFDLKCTFSKHKGEIHEMATEKEAVEVGQKFETKEPEFKKLPNFRALQDESKRKDSIKLFRPFYQEKPQHGRTRREAYNIDSLVEVTNKTWPDWKEKGILVSKKSDGCTAQCHISEGKVKIWTEDGNDVTPNLPTLVEQLSKKKGDWVVIGELELWKDGLHQPRADSSGIINHPGSKDEKGIRLNIYDAFYTQTDIHNEPYAIRRKKYLTFGESANVRVSKPEILVKSEKSLREAVKKTSALPESEGSMLKLTTAPYPLTINPSPLTMVKFKNELQLIAKVIKANPVKGAKAWNYDCALKDALYTGRTFNTGIEAKPGDKIRVSFVDISGYTDPETKKRWTRWYAPHVLEKTTKPADSIAKAWKMVEQTTGRFEDKKLPKAGLV